MERTKQKELAEMMAELTNKVRWSIGTSMESFSGWSYGEQRAVASVIAEEVLELAKAKRESPDFSWDSVVVHSQLVQLGVDKSENGLVK